MRMIIQSTNADGSVVNSPQPWTMVALQDALRSEMITRRLAGITVGGIAISTAPDEDWTRREKHLQMGVTQFAYPQPNSETIVLSASQVTRILDCRDWYGNACMVTELMLWNAAKAAGNLEPIGDALINDLAWPSRTLNFVATQADIDRDNQRMAFLASLGGAQ